jgi:hypothetical protein
MGEAFALAMLPRAAGGALDLPRTPKVQLRMEARCPESNIVFEWRPGVPHGGAREGGASNPPESPFGSELPHEQRRWDMRRRDSMN